MSTPAFAIIGGPKACTIMIRKGTGCDTVRFWGRCKKPAFSWERNMKKILARRPPLLVPFTRFRAAFAQNPRPPPTKLFLWLRAPIVAGPGPPGPRGRPIRAANTVQGWLVNDEGYSVPSSDNRTATTPPAFHPNPSELIEIIPRGSCNPDQLEATLIGGKPRARRHGPRAGNRGYEGRQPRKGRQRASTSWGPGQTPRNNIPRVQGPDMMTMTARCRRSEKERSEGQRLRRADEMSEDMRKSDGSPRKLRRERPGQFSQSGRAFSIT